METKSSNTDFKQRLRQRRLNDQRAMTDAYTQIGTAAVGRSVVDAFAQDHVAAAQAINQILAFYKTKPVNIPDEITDVQQQLDYCLQPAGIMRRRVTLTEGWYKDAIGAFLAVDKEHGRIHALVPKGGLYWFVDPSSGKKTAVNAKTARMFNEDALCFYEPLPQGKLTVKDLLRFFSHSVTLHVALGIVLATLLMTLATAVVPALSRILMTQTSSADSLDLLTSIIVFLVGATVTSSLIGVLKGLLLSRVKQEGLAKIEAALMMRTLDLPASFFSEYGSGDLAYRISSVGPLWEAVVGIIFGSLVSIAVSFVYVIQLFAFAGDVVLPAMGVLAIVVAHAVATVFFATSYNKELMEVSAKRNEFELSALSGVQKVKLSGAEKRIFAQWGRRFGNALRMTYNMPVLLKYNAAITSLITGIGTIIIYACAFGSGLETAEFYAFMMSYGLASGSFVQFASIAMSASKINSTLDLLDPILKAEPEVKSSRGLVSHLKGAVELSHVSFRYAPEAPLVLNDLSLKVEPGEYVAIVGKSGCGKSTLMRLLLGFEKPERGGVFYDGKDLNGLDARSLRQGIGVVMQNDRLFGGSLYSNISITCPELTMDQAWEAAEIACVADDIRAMPMGMHTMVSDGGGGISGGQRQRVAIARAIASKPSLLLFDEATSALDNAAQKKISDALGNMGCTRIVVAHRLSTIKQCDRVVVLDHGQIVADGTFDEVYEKHLAVG